MRMFLNREFIFILHFVDIVSVSHSWLITICRNSEAHLSCKKKVACQSNLYKYTSFTCSPSAAWRERIFIFAADGSRKWLKTTTLSLWGGVSACVGQNPLKLCVCGCVCEITDWRVRQQARGGKTEVVIDDCWFELLL